jgi:putative membrane protein
VPWDPGLQNERTAFAWMRSGLALLGAALILARVSAELWVVPSVVLSAACVVLASQVVVGAAARYRRAAAALKARQPLPDGRLPAAMAAVTTLMGIAVIAVVLTH